jgi:hypothetical protein
MNSTIREMMIQTLKVQVDVCRLQCECLGGDFQMAPTFAERARLARRWDHFLKTGYAAQFMLDLMARPQRESAAC